MKLEDLELFLNDYLLIRDFNDYCPNGVQVEASKEIKKLALGVSASLSLFKKAKQWGAQALLVHHGLFWNNMPYSLKGVHGQRVSYLFAQKLSLLAYHLPLDSHMEVGNNAMIMKTLGLEFKDRFARHGGTPIGWVGTFPKAKSINELKTLLTKKFGKINYFYPYGKKKISSVAVVSGGASKDVMEASALGADLYLTGESGEPIQEWCREAKMNFVALGHYSSEESGVKALGKTLEEKFKIETKFFSVPNDF